MLSPWALLGVIAAIVATLYLLYPRQSLIEQVQQSSDNDQLTADYIAAQLEEGCAMDERELGKQLDALHAFNDAALIRRELVDLGVLDRKRDGSSYCKVADAGDAERWAAIEGPNGRRQT